MEPNTDGLNTIIYLNVFDMTATFRINYITRSICMGYQSFNANNVKMVKNNIGIINNMKYRETETPANTRFDGRLVGRLEGRFDGIDKRLLDIETLLRNNESSFGTLAETPTAKHEIDHAPAYNESCIAISSEYNLHQH